LSIKEESGCKKEEFLEAIRKQMLLPTAALKHHLKDFVVDTSMMWASRRYNFVQRAVYTCRMVTSREEAAKSTVYMRTCGNSGGRLG
jgi:radical SAM superfamily enzyme